MTRQSHGGWVNRAWTHAELVDYWEQRFPGRGQSVADILMLFFRPGFMFSVGEAVDSLEQRAQEAIIWRSITGVMTLQTAVWGKPQLQRFENMLGRKRAGPLTYIWHDMEAELESKLCLQEKERVLQEALLVSVSWPLQRQLWPVRIGGCQSRIRTDPQVIELGLYRTLACAVRTKVMPNCDKDLSALLDLWVHGNYPIGFTNDGRLVLCCKKRP